jgi:hypothetical protein
MVSSFYSNNEKKQRKYIKENKIREINQEEQQQVVDDEISFKLGQDKKASNLSKLASRVVDKISSEIIPQKTDFTPQQYTPLQLLTNIIKTGQLTNLFNEVKALPDSILNKKQKFIRNDLNDDGFKSIMNENIAESAPLGNEAVAKTVLETMGGFRNQEQVYNMFEKTPLISQRGYSVALGREREKRGPKPQSEAEKIAKEVVKDIVKGALKGRKLKPSEELLKEMEEEKAPPKTTKKQQKKSGKNN